MKINYIIGWLIRYVPFFLLLLIFSFILYALGVAINRDGIHILFEGGILFVYIFLIAIFSFLVAFYIRFTKKDTEILAIMEQQNEREEDYLSKLAFLKGLGPIGLLMEYGDHSIFFLFPFVQRGKLYKNINVKKIPFKKKFPFILFFLSMLFIPIFGVIAWLVNY